MGFHVCEYCNGQNQATDRFPFTSSGDVTLEFANSHQWEMPDMILHYVADHGWQPPQEFIDDVMTQRLVGGNRVQYRSMTEPVKIGYLSGHFTTGPVQVGFIDRLESLMHQADQAGNRGQTKSLF